MRVVVVGHDASDAALAKRIGQMRADGHEVRVASLSRAGRPSRLPGGYLDLGPTEDGAFPQRLAAIARAGRTLSRRGFVREGEVCWARNLDAGLAAVAAGAGGRHGPPLVYECLDVHDALSGEGLACTLARGLERRVVRRARRIVVSAPAFETHHFGPRYGRTGLDLIENRVVPDGPRPSLGARADRPMTIGWFGILRCQRSLDRLLGAAAAGQGRLRIVLRGQPAAVALPRFAEQVAACPQAVFAGPYERRDLPNLYAGIDLAWAGDWSQDGANSRWLLPNRLYEAGWHGVPVATPDGTATADWVRRHGTGIVCAADPTPDGLLAALLEAPVDALRDRVAAAPDVLFAAAPGEVGRVLEAARC